MNMKPFGGSPPIDIHDCGMGVDFAGVDETRNSRNHGCEGEITVLR